MGITSIRGIITGNILQNTVQTIRVAQPANIKYDDDADR